jgi:quinohemoprotein ethanol dehydrogenase
MSTPPGGSMMRRWSSLALALGLAVCAVGATAADAPARYGRIDDKRMMNAASEPQNWLVHGGDLSGRHYSALDQINAASVKDLKPAWSLDFDTVRNQEAEPIVVDGVAYVTTAASKVYAVDAASGKLLWKYDPKVSGLALATACCEIVNRGAAVYKGRVYVGALDGRLIALDARTGAEVWSAQTFPKDSLYTITGYPRVIRGKVIIGNGGADLGVRGFVSAYDAQTGKLAWKFWLVPGDPAKGADHAASDAIMETLMRPTWSGDYAKYGGGGTAWDEIDYDPELNQLYVGTGNGSPWNPQYRTDRKGDNLFLCSVVALDPDTGKYIWHYQENPQEAWDYNSVMPMIQTDMTIDGRKHKVLLHAPKNGFFYILDRVTGHVLSAKPLVPGIKWATGIDLKTGRPIETPNSRYESGTFTNSPNTGGAHNWQPMALDPQTGLVYLTLSEGSTTFTAEKDFKPIGIGAFNTGVAREHAFGKSYLSAWNPQTQSEAWRSPFGGGGVLATAGGLVFQGRGSVTGEMVALRADNGQQAWAYPTPNGIVAPPVTYSVDGVQYVMVATGSGAGGPGGGGEAKQRQPGRLIAFRLNGTATLPKEPGPAPPANPADKVWNAAAVQHGKQTYATLCFRCHGPNASSSNVVPDLRRSAYLTGEAAWKAVVMDGVLNPHGMVGWSAFMSAGDAEDIRRFVSSEASKLKAAAKPATDERRRGQAVQREQ